MNLNKENFDKSKLESILKKSKKKDNIFFSTLLFAETRRVEKENVLDAGIYRILGKFTSLHLRSNKPYEPFGPLLVFKNSRSPILDDITSEEVTFVSEIYKDIEDDELRSRLADVLWVIQRDFKAAQIAIDAYLESAKKLEDPENWTYCYDRIERACRLSALLGKRVGKLEKVIKYIEDVINRCGGKDPLFLSAKMMDLLLEFDVTEDAKKYADLSQILAQNAENSNRWLVAREYWHLKAKWENYFDKNAASNSLKNAAETYVKEAEEAISCGSPSYIRASVFLENALIAMRDIGEFPERTKEIQKQLIEYQKLGIKEIKSIKSDPIDVHDIIEVVEKTVSGKSFKDALFELSLMFAPPDVIKLRKEVEENEKKYALQKIFPKVAVNEYGNVIGRVPLIDSNDPKEREEAIRAEMFQNAQFYHQLYTQAYIEPARQIINIEHNGTPNDFLPFLMNNPFVPKGREYFYAKALSEGLHGDLIIMLHLLIPQIENSIRYILQQKENITLGFSSKGIQDERPLTITLYTSELENILGANTVFDLQGLLVERFGQNIRNRLAHGLMNQNVFYTFEVLYIWWLIIRIVCLPLINYETKRKY